MTKTESKEIMQSLEVSQSAKDALLESCCDERYEYLLRNGIVAKQSHEMQKLLVQLSQIPNTLVFYRIDSFRMLNPKM